MKMQKMKAKMQKWWLGAAGLDDSRKLCWWFKFWGRNGVKNGFTPLFKNLI